jgi:purine-nucleoside phosphorylase
MSQSELWRIAFTYGSLFTDQFVAQLVNEAFALANRSAEAVSAQFARAHDPQHDVLVVLGSGWADAVGLLEEVSTTPVQSVNVADIPGFTRPSAIGHGGALKSITVGATRVLLLTGRTHLYEGHGVHAVVHGVRVAHALGCRIALLTNGAGCLQKDWTIGEPVVIKDHINMTGHSPLTGDNPPAPLAGRFVDLTDAYNSSLRALVHNVSPTINEAVYFGFHGPHFETPAEIRAIATLGADMVGMSTVLETIAARHLGMRVLALSLATNLAAGINPLPLSGEDVLQVGKESAQRVGALLRDVLKQIDITKAANFS